MAYERTKMMNNVMVEPTCEPTHDRVRSCIVSRGGEDVINAIIKLVAARGKVRTINGMRGLEYQRHA